MSPPRGPSAPLLALVAMTACVSEHPTAIQVEASAEALDLALSIPELSAADLVVVDAVTAPTSGGPLRTEGEPVEEAPGDAADYLEAVATIYNPRTLVGMGAGLVYAWGDHRYQGNKGRVQTTANVSFGGRRIGSQTVAREESGLFLIDGPRVKYISVMAKVYSDRECGLSVTGSTTHSAWWEWFLGMGVPTWGLTAVPSDGGPESQPACSEGPGPGGGPTDGSSAVCYISIDYDTETGEIVSQELLFCTGVGEQQGG